MSGDKQLLASVKFLFKRENPVDPVGHEAVACATVRDVRSVQSGILHDRFGIGDSQLVVFFRAFGDVGGFVLLDSFEHVASRSKALLCELFVGHGLIGQLGECLCRFRSKRRVGFLQVGEKPCLVVIVALHVKSVKMDFWSAGCFSL